MSDLTLYCDAKWESPWSFHAIVALNELGVPYRLVPVQSPISPEIRTTLRENATLGLTPCLAAGDFWLTESAAISEYLAEVYPTPAHPSLYPTDRHERARARQLMSWLRTSMMGLRGDRPTSSVFMRPVKNPLSDKGRADADELVRVAMQVIPHGATQLFAQWSIAEADFALMLMRLVANGDPVPQTVHDYTLAQWGRQSIRKFVGYIPTQI